MRLNRQDLEAARLRRQEQRRQEIADLRRVAIEAGRTGFNRGMTIGGIIGFLLGIFVGYIIAVVF